MRNREWITPSRFFVLFIRGNALQRRYSNTVVVLSECSSISQSMHTHLHLVNSIQSKPLFASWSNVLHVYHGERMDLIFLSKVKDTMDKYWTWVMIEIKQVSIFWSNLAHVLPMMRNWIQLIFMVKCQGHNGQI